MSVNCLKYSRSGWGKLGDTESWSKDLRKTFVPIVSKDECERNVRN